MSKQLTPDLGSGSGPGIYPGPCHGPGPGLVGPGPDTGAAGTDP